MLSTYDIVVIDPGYEDAEVAGRQGYVIGLIEADQMACSGHIGWMKAPRTANQFEN